MHVQDFLPGIGTHVREYSVAAIGDARLFGRSDDESQQVVPFALLPEVKVVERQEVLAGHNEQVLRSFGVHISKGDETIVL